MSNNDFEKDAILRNKVIVKTSIIGIITNVFLVIFKMIIGLLVNSIAIILDAINNLSDALSSTITIIGAKIANKAPDKQHPLGHGRAEYLSALIVAVIVLYAGITSLIECIKKIIHPEMASYTNISLIIVAIAVIVKIILGNYVKKKGQEVDSNALIASGSDALFDAIISFSVLVSAFIFIYTNISLEAYLGVIIAGYIIKSGIEMVQTTLSDILGKRADSNLTQEIKRIISEEPEVRGAFDLFINDYGPNKNYASIHIELRDDMNVAQVDELTRRLQEKVLKETGIVLTTVGVYSYNTSDDEAAVIRNKVLNIVMSHDFAIQLHGFYVDIKNKEMRFDVVMSFDINPLEGQRIIKEEIKKIYPDYNITIAADLDLSD